MNPLNTGIKHLNFFGCCKTISATIQKTPLSQVNSRNDCSCVWILIKFHNDV